MGSFETVKDEIIKELEESEIIDCHEHLVEEEERISTEVDVFTLFSQYARRDLLTAGMNMEDNSRLFSTNTGLDQKWNIFEPYWENIRYGSFAKAATIAARRFYGGDSVSLSACEGISQRMKKANKKGLYDKVLKETCKIRTILNQNQKTSTHGGLFTPVIYAPLIEEDGPVTREKLNSPYFSPGSDLRDVEAYLEAAGSYMRKMIKEGTVAFKINSFIYLEPDLKEAQKLFKLLISGKIREAPVTNPITDCLLSFLLDISREHDMPVAVHSGYWNDFRQTSPSNMIPVFERHPENRFDLYHLGIPYIRKL